MAKLHQLPIRFTKEQRYRLDSKASLAGFAHLSDYIRHSCLKDNIAQEQKICDIQLSLKKLEEEIIELNHKMNKVIDLLLDQEHPIKPYTV